MKILVNGQTATLVSSDTLIQNSSTIYTVEFEFDDSWDGYDKTIIFKAGRTEESVSLTGDVCIIPSNCLKEAGVVLKLGIFGTKNGETTNTIWFNTTRILYNWEIISGGYSAPIRSGELVNHVAKFYTSPDKSGDPAFTMNIPEEMFLDQTKTEFVNDFVWSLEEYPGSTDPDLDGKSVFVLAVKGEDPESPPSYSFLDMDIPEEMFLDQTKTEFVNDFVWSLEEYPGSTNPDLDGKPVLVLAVKGEDPESPPSYSFLDMDMGGGDLPDDIYDMLPYGTVSGETVEFTDGADNVPVKSFIVDLGVKINSDVITIDDVQILSSNPSAIIQLPKELSAETYTISFNVDPLTNNEYAFINIGLGTQDTVVYQTQIYYPVDENERFVTHTFTLSSDVSVLLFSISGVSSTCEFSSIKIVEGSEPATDSDGGSFEPYTGVTIINIGEEDNNLFDGPDVALNTGLPMNYVFTTPLEAGRYIIRGSFKDASSNINFSIALYRNFPVVSQDDVIATRTVDLKSVTGPEYTEYSFEEVFVCPDVVRTIIVNVFQSSGTINIPDFSIIKQIENTIEVEFSDEVGTVYSGTFDITKGKLKVTHAFYEFDGSESWSKQSGYFKSNFLDHLDAPVVSSTPNGYFSSLPFVNIYNNPTDEGAMILGGSDYDDSTDESYYYARIFIRVTGHENDTDTEFKSYITSLYNAGTPLQAVYELYEPIVYDLNETEIKTFFGRNTFTSDATGMNVIYRANTNLYVEGYVSDYVEDAIDSLPKYVLIDDVWEVLPDDNVTGGEYGLEISDGADDVPVKSFTIDLNVKQNGEGTPSTSNFRGFTPYTSADSVQLSQYGKSYLIDDVTVSGSTNTIKLSQSIPPGKYRLNIGVNVADPSYAEYGYIKFTLYGSTGTVYYVSEQLSPNSSGDLYFEPFVLESPVNSIEFKVYSGASYISTITDLSIQAFKDPIEISLSLTPFSFYCGQIDPINGGLHITHQFYNLSNSSWSKSSGNNPYFYTTLATGVYEAADPSAEWFCSILPSAIIDSSTSDDGCMVVVEGTNTRLRVRMADRMSNTTSVFRTFIQSLKNSTPLQILYKKQYATYAKLNDGAEIRTFLGENQFQYSITGTVQDGISANMDYKADVDLYVEKKLSEGLTPLVNLSPLIVTGHKKISGGVSTSDYESDYTVGEIVNAYKQGRNVILTYPKESENMTFWATLRSVDIESNPSEDIYEYSIKFLSDNLTGPFVFEDTTEEGILTQYIIIENAYDGVGN